MLRYPRAVLAITLLAITLLGILGSGVEEKLSPVSLNINGTPSARANDIYDEHFGDSTPFVVLLRGPASALDRQGPELIRGLRASDPGVRTLSPWDRGPSPGDALRPGRRRALVVVSFPVGVPEAVRETVPELNQIIEEEIEPPVNATQTGYPTLTKAIQDESIAATLHSERIALPILLIVLLLVFRSPIAAAIPLAFGVATVISSRGLLYLFTNWFSIDAFALTVCTMMGLALGVDYALLMVSRYREELAGGADPVTAAVTTRQTAGRTTVFAGSTLMLSMLVAFFIVPGSLLASLAATTAMVVALSVLVAITAGPAVLILLGRNLDRWRIGSAQPNGESRLMAIVRAALRRPAPVAIAIGALIAVLAAPALALKTGPPSQAQLPADDPARKDAELINRAAGAGFEAPFVIVAATDHGQITDSDHLDVLARWQRRIANRPGVQAVVGPAQVSRAVAPLQEQGSALLADDEEDGPLANLDRLGRNLGRVATGVTALREGISQATFGAGLLADGTGNAEEGALAIAQGLGQAAAGSQSALKNLNTFADGTRQLANAQRRASLGGLVLKTQIRDLVPNLRHNGLRRQRKLQKALFEDANVKLPQLQSAAKVADEQLKTALQQLDQMTVGKTDPNYDSALEAVRQAIAAVSGANPATGQPFAPEYTGLPTELAGLQARLLENAEEAQLVSRWIATTINTLTKLSSVAKQLSEGLNELQKAGNRIADGAAQIVRRSTELSDGLGQLDAGAEALAGGLTQLTGGTATLEDRLSEAYSRSYPAQSGLRRMQARVISGNATLNRRLDRIRRATPKIFDSGYFVLSALDGSAPALRERAEEAVDLDNGGQAATLQVFSRYALNSDGSIDLNKRLNADAEALGREAGVTAGVGGGPATLNDYSRVSRERIPYVVAAITIATFLILILVLRALPLAAIAVGLNLVTVGVAFGILTLLFNVPEGWPLGGRTYVDAVGATMIFGLLFGLSIDYAVFLLVRMREHYDRNGDTAAAIEFGLEKTARVITGAAAIMMAVFIAFAGAPIATVSQLGIGLTVAVLLDATVVRIVLLPALMLLMGDKVWWYPRWMERVTPRLNV